MPYFERGYAIIVGVGSYHYAPWTIPATANDATDLEAILSDPQRCAYPPHQVQRLTGAAATRPAIEAALAELQHVPADSTVILFFSGHGWSVAAGPQAGYYFLCHDTQPAADGVDLATALPNTVIVRALQQSRAQKIILFCNTCFAGGLGVPLALGPGAGGAPAPLPLAPFDAQLNRLVDGRGRVIVASSMAGEVSYVPPGGRNSIFVEALLEGLRGGGQVDGAETIQFFRLFDSLGPAIERRLGAWAVSQTPVLRAYDLTGDFALALRPVSPAVAPLAALTTTPATGLAPTSLAPGDDAAALHGLLTRAFNAGALRRLCRDHFPTVLADLPEHPTLNQVADRLIEYCQEQDCFSVLWPLLAQHNPNRWAEYQARRQGGERG